MARIDYTIVTGVQAASSGTALAAGTSRSVLGVQAHANSGIQLNWFRFNFDGITSSALVVIWELCRCTFVTKPPGTNSTLVTPVQTCGLVITPGFTAAKDWAAANEPTLITVLDGSSVAPDKGGYTWQAPLGTEPDMTVSTGFVLRMTAPAAVNVYAAMNVSRI